MDRRSPTQSGPAGRPVSITRLRSPLLLVATMLLGLLALSALTGNTASLAHAGSLECVDNGRGLPPECEEDDPVPDAAPAFGCDVFNEFPDEPPEQEDADWLPPCPPPIPAGELIVTKVVVGGPGGVAAPASAFGFTVTQGGAPMPPFTEQFPGADGTTSYSIPFTAIVTVEETTSLPDYVVSNTTCVNLAVARSVLTTCTITNTYVPPPPPPPPATLRIKKLTTDGSAADHFTFTHPTQGAAGAFDLSHDEMQSFELDAGTYQVSEIGIPDGWVLQGVTCLGGADDGDVLLDAVTITLAPGEDVTCTFLQPTAAAATTRADGQPQPRSGGHAGRWRPQRNRTLPHRSASHRSGAAAGNRQRGDLDLPA